MNFLLHCDHIWSFVKSGTNVNCLEVLQFFQVSLAAHQQTGVWSWIFTQFQRISITNLTLFRRKQKKGRFWSENGRMEMIPKNRFLAKMGGLESLRKIWMRKDGAKQVFSAILNVVTSQANLVRFQDSSIIKCYRRHENWSRSIVL